MGRAGPAFVLGGADEYERANGRLYREVQFALPKELSEGQRRELASGFAKRLTEGERLPYTLAIHRGDGENPHAHLMFSERANDGIERSVETWFRRHNAAAPEKGGARKSRAAVPQAWLEDTRKAWEREANGALERAGCGERIDHRSLAERRDEAERAGDLERAAELSRKPNVHLGPQALRELPGEPESFVHQKAERVEKDNESLVEERDGLIERIKERIAVIYRELQALPEKIRAAGERVKAWEKEREREWVHGVRVREGQGREDRRDHKEILPHGGAANQQYAPLASAHTRTRARRGAEPVMAGIHQTLKEARSFMRKRSSCKKRCLPSHRDLEGSVAQVPDVAQVGGGAHGAGRDIDGAAQESREWLSSLGCFHALHPGRVRGRVSRAAGFRLAGRMRESNDSRKERRRRRENT